MAAVWAGRMATGFHPRRKKNWNWYSARPTGSVFREMPKQDWTLHALKLFGSLFGRRAPTNPQLCIVVVSSFGYLFHPENLDGNFSCLVLSDKIMFLSLLYWPDVVMRLFFGRAVVKWKVEENYFSPDKSRHKTDKREGTVKIYCPKYFRLGDWFGIKFYRWTPQNDNKVTQNCYHLNWITLCWDSLRDTQEES